MAKYFQFILIISLIVLIGFSIFAPIVFAAGLVPCGNPGQKACTVCDFFSMADDIIKYTIKYIVPTVAAILMVVGAFFYMTAGGLASQIKKGHDIITSTVIGVVIVLLAWIIVDSAIKALTGKSQLLGKPWSTIECKQ